MKTHILAMLLCAVLPTAFAQTPSPVEQAATRMANDVRFLISSAQTCDAFKTAPRRESKPVVTLDARGRVSYVVDGASAYVLEYGTDRDTKPSAIVAGGQRTALSDGTVSDAAARLRALAILYRQFRAVCGLPPATQPVLEAGTTAVTIDPADSPAIMMSSGDCGGSSCLDGTGEWGGSISAEWYDPGFWEQTWWGTFAPAVTPEPRCMVKCETACDIVGELMQVGCGVVTGVAAVVASPVAAIAIGGACSLGMVIGHWDCRLRSCVVKCTY